ncbi:MAG TPA: polynucleotide adenylyltransferase PcnB [Candidatus Binataceae bacterium]|nr:polynucleotide adenylyltransferase PcnB [Candidatus Binataceae bacterium]
MGTAAHPQHHRRGVNAAAVETLERAQHPISRREIDPNVLKVLYRLINAGYEAFLVGGSVRDLMLGRTPKDFDVGTSAHPQQIRELFRNSRLIGRRFKLVHVFFGPQNIEVATFRRRSEEVVAEGDPLIRHDNTFGTPQEDAQRRDFTINALFYDPKSFRVVDYTGGLLDLQARLIRTVDDPEVRMREDPVRMIRAVRFAAKLDFQLEAATRDAIVRHRADLLKTSTPRLVEEIFRTFTNAPPKRALLLMAELGLLEVVLPFLYEHLRPQLDCLEAAHTTIAMGSLEAASEAGMLPSRALTLACLLADLWFARSQLPQPGADLITQLRERGFPRGEIERMRLLLNAAGRIARPNHRLRGLSSRPYYEEARTLFTLLPPAIFGPAPRRVEGSPPASVSSSRRRRRPRRRRLGARRPDTTPSENATATLTSVGGHSALDPRSL